MAIVIDLTDNRLDFWERECAVWESGERRLYMYSKNAGEVAHALAVMNLYAGSTAVVSSLKNLDILVKLGIQPSRIMVTGEVPTRTFDFRMFDFLWE